MTAIERIQQDSLALSVARAVAIANDTAITQGLDPDQSLVTVMEETPPPQRVWRVNYGPRDYVRRRGGDLIVYVDDTTGTVQRLLRGQ